MSNSLKRQLAVMYTFLLVITVGTGIIGQTAHHLDLLAALALGAFFIIFSSVYTWWSIHDEKDTLRRELEVSADLADLGLSILKGKNGIYGVIDDETPTNTMITESLSLGELEAFRDGVMQGLLLMYEPGPGEDADGSMEARLARQEQQHLEDRQHIGTFGDYIPDIPGMEDNCS